jgi:G3E family GTPase
VGCSLATSLVSEIKNFRRKLDPDFLFIEPSEIVVTREMRNVSSMGLRDVKYATGPFITLVDGPAFEASWEERRPLILGQVEGADAVAVSRSDLVDAGRVKEIVRVLRGYTEKVFQMSVIENTGLGKVMELLDLQSQGLEGM